MEAINYTYSCVNSTSHYKTAMSEEAKFLRSEYKFTEHLSSYS